MTIVTDQTQRRIYKSDPIQEAVCEFRFSSPEKGWALLPGQIYSLVSDLFPQEPVQLESQELFRLSAGGPGAAEIRVGNQAPPVEFRSEDERLGLTVKPMVMVVHARRPYVGWDRMSSTIQRCLEATAELLPDFSLSRIGLRYINRVSIPAPLGETSDYFRLRPLHLAGDSELQTFIARSEHRLGGDDNRRLIATFASGELSEDTFDVILDLDVIQQGLSLSDPAEILRLVVELREVERYYFEESITSRTREELFGGFTVTPSR